MSLSYQWIPKKWFLLLQRVFLPSECLHSHVVGQHVKEMLEAEMKIIFIKWIYFYILSSFERKQNCSLLEIWQLVLLQMTEADISMVIKAIDAGFIPVSLNSSDLSPKLSYFFTHINISVATQLYISLVFH